MTKEDLAIGIELNIDTAEVIDLIVEYLGGLRFEYEKESLDKGSVIWLSFEKLDQETYVSVTNLIREIIREFYLEAIIKKRIGKIYSGEVQADEDLIEDIKTRMSLDYIYGKEEVKIVSAIRDYIRTNNYINLEGYIRFRLYEYLYIVDVNIDDIVTTRLEERKVEELFGILQNFVNMKEPSINLINVILEGEEYTLKDANLNLIDPSIEEEIHAKFLGVELSKLDILFASLISLAPKRIVVHAKDNPIYRYIFEAMKSIFPNRLVLCHGCDICKLNENSKDGLDK